MPTPLAVGQTMRWNGSLWENAVLDASDADGITGLPYYDVRHYGAVGDGVTDDQAAITAAMTAAAVPGGAVVFPGGKAWAIASTLTLKSSVHLVFAGGAYLKWTGAVGGTCVETDDTAVVQNCCWYGLTIDTGASFTGTALHIHSAHNISADVIRLVTTGATSKALVMSADSSGGESALTKRNITAVYIGSLVQHGVCGTLLETSGVTAGYDASAQVVTLCTIGSVFGQEQNVYGFNFKNWTDNNNFPGMNRLSIVGNNSVGVQIGGASGVDNLGVYMLNFGTVAVDSFGVYTGRVGVAVDRSKLTKIEALYQNPVAEGGAFTSTTNAASYDVRYHRDSDGAIIGYRRGESYSGGAFNSSEVITLADDTAASIDMSEEGSDENICFMVSVTTFGASGNGIAWCKVRRSSGSPASSKVGGDAFFAVSTGVLTGTTGTDVRVTVSPAADGKLYIENRIGSSISFVVSILGKMQVA
jgi:hypothetical protein